MEQDQQIVTRIGFTEQWLDRAKQQCAEGNVARSWLTLVLADAEMHHALQAAAPTTRSHSPRTVAAAMIAIAAVAGAVIIAATQWPGRQAAISGEPAPPIVRLSAPVGQLLEIAAPSSPAQAAAPAQAASPTRRTARRIAPPTDASKTGRSAATAIVPAASTPSPAPAPVMTVQAPTSLPTSPQHASSQVATPPEVSRPALEISAGELIDLVLAAERTLRSDANRP